MFVPLAKWPMLIAGNYRCIPGRPRAIKEAVHANLDDSREVYDWVANLCLLLGADAKDLVPFEKYAAAARAWAALVRGARAVRRRAAHRARRPPGAAIARQKGMQLPILDEVVNLVDARLEVNRKKAA